MIGTSAHNWTAFEGHPTAVGGRREKKTVDEKNVLVHARPPRHTRAHPEIKAEAAGYRVAARAPLALRTSPTGSTTRPPRSALMAHPPGAPLFHSAAAAATSRARQGPRVPCPPEEAALGPVGCGTLAGGGARPPSPVPPGAGGGGARRCPQTCAMPPSWGDAPDTRTYTPLEVPTGTPPEPGWHSPPPPL